VRFCKSGKFWLVIRLQHSGSRIRLRFRTTLHMLCDKCQQREATHHVHHFTSHCDETGRATTADGSPAMSNLCNECFGDSSPSAREIKAAWAAGCFYCGGEPIMTAPDLSAAPRNEQKTTVLCEPCSGEFFRCAGIKFPGMADGSITPRQAANSMAVLSEIHEHMKKWVSERDKGT
jgi:hypothetical protein